MAALAAAAVDGTPIKPEPKAEPKSTLTPPTSEEADKHDGSSSELSDLELDNEDIGEIEPDHYYEGGRIPVFKPVCRPPTCRLPNNARTSIGRDALGVKHASANRSCRP